MQYAPLLSHPAHDRRFARGQNPFLNHLASPIPHGYGNAISMNIQTNVSDTVIHQGLLLCVSVFSRHSHHTPLGRPSIMRRKTKMEKDTRFERKEAEGQNCSS